jgi:hypothetical protein
MRLRHVPRTAMARELHERTLKDQAVNDRELIVVFLLQCRFLEKRQVAAVGGSSAAKL